MVLDVVNKFLSFKMWMWILIGLNFISKVQGYSNRPFPESCHSMLPEHRDRIGNLVGPQNTKLPFEVHYELGNDGEPITVFLRSKSSTKFRGFLLEARDTGNLEGSVGKFIILESSKTRFQSCNGLPDSAVRQANKLKQTSVRVNWTAEGAELDITFRATFVESFWKFWRPVDVKVILPTTSTTKPTTTTSTTKPTTTSTTKPTTTTSTTKPTTTSTTKPTTTTSTTKPTTTSTTRPSTTTSTTKPSTTCTTERSTTSTTEPSTTTSTTKPSTTTTTAPSTKSTTEPSTTKPGTTASSTEPSITASTTKPSTSSTIKPSTAASTTKPSTIGTTKPSTAASTTKPSTIGTTKPSTAESTTKPSTSNTTKPSTTAPGPGPIPSLILQKASMSSLSPITSITASATDKILT
ncbi:mucin-2-like [Seriola aureovittata]|uniref:mucin-2-like n=1 Tax=Seriola aureovittata TaxID=2871759 RepID=UPI0024BDE834|nr:mucin-2-like [Seriola aureovittata]